MTRLADGRTTHLTAEEIARETLRQFDIGPREPSIRSLAEALSVTPRAIYHYYDTRADLVRAAVRLVWEEVAVEVIEELGGITATEGDSVEFFIIVALASRHAFAHHHRIAVHLGFAPDSDSRTSGAVTIAAARFEQMGLTGEEAGLALYAFLTYVLGSILLEASQRLNEELLAEQGLPSSPEFSSIPNRPEDAPEVTDDTSRAVDRVFGLRPEGPRSNDELYVAGLRLLLANLQARVEAKDPPDAT